MFTACRRFCLILLSLATFPGIAPGQLIGMPEEKDAENKAFTPKLPTQSLPIVRAGLVTKEPLVVWVASEGQKPTTYPGKDELPLGGQPIPFLQPYRICYRFQAKDKEYVLLAESKSKDLGPITLIGWVPEEIVIEGNESLRDQHFIHRKALLVNTPDSLAKKDNPSTVPLRNAPDGSGKIMADLKLANYLFVWAQTADSVLLGSSYYFQPGDPKDARRKVLGWAPIRRVMFWRTKEALEWDVTSTLDAKARRPLGQVFLDPDAALRHLKEGKQKDDVLFPETRLPGGVAREMKPFEPRYPVLEWEPGKKEKQYTAGSNKLIRVAWFGGGDNQGLIDAKREKLRQIAEQMKASLEVVFVMDETGGMRKWYPDVAKAVQRFVDDAKATPIKSVKIAFAFYADDEEGAYIPAKPMKLVDARGKEGDALVDMLNARARNPKDVVGGGGPREMVFHGIREAYAGAGFSALARKLIVVIGDDGDKSNEKDPKHPGETALAKLLAKEGQTHCELLVVQTQNRGPDGEAFKTQMNTLGTMLDKAVGEKAFRFYPLESSDLFVKRVSQGYQELVDKLQREDEELERLRMGDVVRTAAFGPALIKLLTERGIKPEDFKNTQVCEPGYVWRYADADGMVPQVNVRILMSSYDVDVLLGHIKPLVEYRPGTTALKDLYREMIERSTTGGKEKLPAGTSFAEAVLKRKGLTVRSALLNKDPSFLPDRLVEE